MLKLLTSIFQNVFLVSLKKGKQDLIAGNESHFFSPKMLFKSTQMPVILLLHK